MVRSLDMMSTLRVAMRVASTSALFGRSMNSFIACEKSGFFHVAEMLL